MAAVGSYNLNFHSFNVLNHHRVVGCAFIIEHLSKQTFLTNALLTVSSSNDNEDIMGVVSDAFSGFMSRKDSYPVPMAPLLYGLDPPGAAE